VEGCRLLTEVVAGGGRRAALLAALLALAAALTARELLRDRTPNRTYASKLVLGDYLDLVAPLDADERMSELERELIELLAQNKRALAIPATRRAVLEATKDGTVAAGELEELRKLLPLINGFASERAMVLLLLVLL
jgi:hypothetical protein